MNYQHLERAKEYLAIAESGDSKREAYKAAAEEIAAAIGEGNTQVYVATYIGKSQKHISQMLKWRKSGYEADTPWLADTGATTRAAVSHTKAILRDAPLEQVETILASVPVSRRAALATALVAQGDVADAIHADPEASKVHLRMTDAIVGQAVDRGTERGRKESRTTRDIDASRHYSDAAKEMADGNAIIFAHSPEGEALDRCDAAVARVKQHVETYEEIRGLVH